MYRIIFLVEAIDEIEQAGKWYAAQQPDLDKRFTETILVTIERLQSDKIIYGAVYRGLSRVLVKRFPYIIYFKKDIGSNLIIIYGILHIKQSRSQLDKRR